MESLIAIGAIALLALLTGGWLVSTYNLLVRERNLVREAWSGIDVQLQRRYDLIPNLVETVKGYAQHERGVFEWKPLLRGQAKGPRGHMCRRGTSGAT